MLRISCLTLGGHPACRETSSQSSWRQTTRPACCRASCTTTTPSSPRARVGDARYSQVAYASYFPQEIGGILTVFDQWLAGTSLPSSWLSIWQHPRCGHAAKHLLRQCGRLWLHAHADAVGAARDPPACPACPTLLCRTRRQVPATVSHPPWHQAPIRCAIPPLERWLCNQ